MYLYCNRGAFIWLFCRYNLRFIARSLFRYPRCISEISSEKLEYYMLLILNLFCIQIRVWMRARQHQPSLTPQSWSWKDVLNIWAFPWFSQERAFWDRVRPRAPQQWTWSKALVFSYVASDPLCFLARCHKPSTCKVLQLYGQQAWNNSWENVLRNRDH